MRSLPRLRSGLARDVTLDVLVVLTAVGASLSAALDGQSVLRPFGGATAGVLVLAALSLAVRRRAPVTVAWISAALAGALLAVEYAAPGTLLHTGGRIDAGRILWWTPTAPFAAYAVMAFPASGRPAWTRWPPVVALVVLVSLTPEVLPRESLHEIAGQDTGTGGVMISRSLFAVIAGALLGMYVQQRRRVVQGLQERAERAEHEQFLLAEQARAEERARLAAEMHDVVAHRVTLMVLQAGVLRVHAPDEATRQAAEELRATGCQALEELRDVIGLLRRAMDGDDADDDDHAPLPDLSALISESNSVGVATELVEVGDAPLASPVVGRTAYRIVQEALTNVRKHAPGAQARVEVRYRADGVRLRVRNSPPTAPPDADLVNSGSGTGLEGLRQRVELIGGAFASGGEPGGGFAVEVSLPAYIPTNDPAPTPR
ncbi:sensor histidine kinase [Actinomadura geliboluensis]|uniref:sensor histidine kinase n=1 Tax=Actinomadura geliboluensis TaxID=882440 RepID=UPI00369606B7